MNSKPQILVLHFKNVGDRNQAEAFAQLIGWPYRLFEITSFKAVNLSTIGNPKPDIIIAVDRRCTGIALKLKQRSRKPVKIIKLGTPDRPVLRSPNSPTVDLCIANGQYRSRPAAGIVVQELPFSLVNEAQLKRARLDFQMLASLPSPRMAVLVGGNNRYFEWTPDVARQLGWRINASAAKHGCSLMITGSYRTGADCTEALLAEIKVPHVSYRWGETAGPNPLNGYLAYADRILVTMDSIAMITDALCAGKPLSIYRLKTKRMALLKSLVEWFVPLSGRTALIRKLIASGQAAWFDRDPPPPTNDVGKRYEPAIRAARALVVDGGCPVAIHTSENAK